MTGWKLFLTCWEFHPSVIIGCLILLGIYLFAVRFRFNFRTINYSLGVLVIFLALVSPLDPLGDDYLFSAHMLQHIMLGFIATPLLVAGLPESLVRSWMRIPFIARVERILGFPPLSLNIGNTTFWLWHYPLLYNATLENEAVHIFEHIVFLITGCIMFWPVFKPIPDSRLSPMASLVYLMIAAFLNAILGIVFSISDTCFYSGYANPPDELGALSLIRGKWHLDQLNDQKLGGAIMWGFGSVVFLWAMMMVMIDWFKEKES